MRWRSLLSNIGLLFLFCTPASAQDLGQRDRLYLALSAPPAIGLTDQTVVVQLWATNDANSLIAIEAGFGWTAGDLRLDSASQSDAHWMEFFYRDGSLESANTNRRFLYAGVSLTEENALPPDLQPLHLADYYFTLHEWLPGRSFVIDSLFWGPGSERIFAPASGSPYVPEWLGPLVVTADSIVPGRWYVAPHGNDLTGDGSMDNPFATIQHAIDISYVNDSILVLPGVYSESLNFLGKNLVVRSTDGPLVTTITNVRTANLVVFDHGENDQAVLEGFTLRGGWIGILCVGSGPSVRHNLLIDQNVDNWSAIALCGATDIYIQPDGSTRYSAVAGPAPAVIVNNTVVGCFNGGISTFSTVAPTIRNNIIAFNHHYGIHKEGLQPGVTPPLLGFNDVYGNPENYQEISFGGEGTISANPLFNPDYSLGPGSPCIDAGDPDPSYADPDGSRADIGAIGGNVGRDIVIPTSQWINVFCAAPTMNGGPIRPGAVIQAFDPYQVLCGMGIVREDGSFGYIPVYADDPYTEIDEGAEPGDEIRLKIDGQLVSSDPLIFWTENLATFEVCEFYNWCLSRIPLHAGWNLISWNVDYAEALPQAALDIIGCVDVILSYDQGGKTYDPNLPQFSTLTELDFYHGYWFRMNCDTVLQVTGDPADPGPIPVSEGWNLVAARVWFPISVAEAFQMIMDNLSVAAGFDNGALTWISGMSQFNTLTSIRPGFGYWLKLSADDTVWYPNFDPALRASAEPLFGAQTGSRSTTSLSQTPGEGILGTRNWMSVYGSGILLDGAPLGPGDRLEFFTQAGDLCGSGTYGDGILKFTPVYGRDETDGSSEKYAADGGAVQVFVNGRRAFPDLTWEGNGSRVPLERLFSDPSGVLPRGYSLEQNYPNPFNPTTVIGFGLPAAAKVTITVYNVLGRQVRILTDAYYGAGSHKVEWNGCDDSGRRVSSGLYLYRLQTGSYTESKKMVLLK